MRIARIFPIIVLLLFSTLAARAQFLMDMIDTTSELGKGMISLYQKYDALRFSGYIQPQFQAAQSKGAAGYAGGDFGAAVNNRFTLRRGRIRVDYERFNKQDMPVLQFAFQFDGTERGVAIRDFYGRFFENRFNVLSLVGGMFARPFGYEVNLSSADRETPERGRMSQILMKTERDLGAMVTFEPRRKDHPLRFLRIDVGAFNGQGLTATSDFDSHKDFVGRVSVKPRKIIKGTKATLSGGVSVLYGGMEQFTNTINTVGTVNGKPGYMVDSATYNLGKIAPRHYYGADVQLKIPNGPGKGSTQFRAEYIRGQQSATALASETPGIIPVTPQGKPQPLYIRKFDGAYLYFIQHLGSDKHQVVVKYDWYDPNKKVSGKDITATAGFTAADISYKTLGIGYVYYANEHLKFMFYYDWVTNENTALERYKEDLKDNVLTCRMQYRF